MATARCRQADTRSKIFRRSCAMRSLPRVSIRCRSPASRSAVWWRSISPRRIQIAPNVSSSSIPRRDIPTCCAACGRSAPRPRAAKGVSVMSRSAARYLVHAGVRCQESARPCVMCATASRACQARAMHCACEALAGGDLRPLVPRITAPTMVVCGTEDIPEFIEAANWLHAQIAGSKLQWLSPARHCSILEQPEAFNPAVPRLPCNTKIILAISQIVGLLRIAAASKPGAATHGCLCAASLSLV